MLHIYELAINTKQLTQPIKDVLEVVLAYDQRKKSRLRAESVCGEAIGFFLPRGTVLRQDDFFRSEQGRYVKIIAASETVSEVIANDALQLMRAAYHLGNRHVPLQIEQHWLRYQSDHVLDDMVEGLGLSVTHKEATFEPEGGAYSSGHYNEEDDEHHEHSSHHHHSHS